jgi:signal transduction histidine kinase
LPRIFEPFVSHGKANGTGLGLAISKSVVEAHRGSISIKSSQTGTTFTIELPLEPDSA